MLVAPRQSTTATTTTGLYNSESDQSETLEYFIQIFSQVTRLTNIYMKLNAFNCVLFDSCVAKIFCDQFNKRLEKNQATIDISFLNTSYNDNSTFKIDFKQQTTLVNLNNLCNLMETCLLRWELFINCLRDTFVTINYFTLNQIEYLRRMFNKCLSNGTSLDVDFEMINSLLFNIIDQNEGDFTIEKLKILMNQLNIDPNSNEIENFKTSLNYQLKKEQNDTLNIDFEQMWQNFIESQLKTKNDGSSLNLIQFAHLITLIHKQPSYNRTIPGYLSNRGTCNLILCSQMDQTAVALSIYGHCSEAPLPDNNEILFCSQDTTGEECECFLRIAFSFNNNNNKQEEQRIYTIMNGQSLNYETASHIEKFINNSEIKKRDDYILVVICTTDENDNKHKTTNDSTSSSATSSSMLALLFAKFCIKPIIIPATNIEQYLATKLIINNDLNIKTNSVLTLLSHRSGNGKSSFAQKFADSKSKQNYIYNIIRIKDMHLNIDKEVDKLFKLSKANTKSSCVFHIDIAYECLKNLDNFLFNLIICGSLKHSNGLVWRRIMRKNDIYLIEMTPPYINNNEIFTKIMTPQQHFNNTTRINQISFHSLLNYLPNVQFRSPKSYLEYLINEPDAISSSHLVLQPKDNQFAFMFELLKVQRCCYYLKLLADYKKQKDVLKEAMAQRNRSKRNHADEPSFMALDSDLNEKYNHERHKYTQIECLDIILNCSKLNDPSWMELNNFIQFLDKQLETIESSKGAIDHIPMLRGLCLQFIIIMANDFGLPSMRVIDDSKDSNDTKSSNNQIAIHRLELDPARRWENMIHPFLIVNADGETLTLLGTYYQRNTRCFMNPHTERPISEVNDGFPIISSKLFLDLLGQRIPVYENFNSYIREKKCYALANVMGVDPVRSADPDPTYELNVDNCLKLMAIYLRFNCNNPVIITGETGCGKTRLIKFFCDFHHLTLERSNGTMLKIMNPLVHVKIHGGTTAVDIENKLKEAEALSAHNYDLFELNKSHKFNNSHITAVLFFDEANTSEAVGLIKEIMCDLTCNGRPVKTRYGLKIIAAINPYRKHSDEMIKKMEQAGLGFYISSNNTKERFGYLPMRQLVYRVQPLPLSLIPLVWDFGQLEKNVETVYIKQLIKNAIQDKRLPKPDTEDEVSLIVKLMAESQNFMRSRNDECSFVSLRDIERVIVITKWFMDKKDLIFVRMDAKQLINETNNSQDLIQKLIPTSFRRSFILSLSVCYHSSLSCNETRKQFRDILHNVLITECSITNENTNSDWILSEILKCQHIFLDEIELTSNQKNIAKNTALLENVFMMIICIELRIPLFIVGKPGSSKSLAKSIVARAMEGRNSKSPLFQELKETYFVNFQCSPLTTPEMIIKAFKEAARFQHNNDLDKSVAIVNLDEIGLAEGSEMMPLKALHSLLEEGIHIDDNDHHNQGSLQKVGVIGISNWSLDPAKQNRGIFVSRGTPDIEELISSAKGICKYDNESIYDCIEPYIRDISLAYLELCGRAREHKREFFGLRDFYSLIKMIYNFCAIDCNFTWSKLEHSVKRNFGGLDIDVIKPFSTLLKHRLDSSSTLTNTNNEPKSTPIDLLEAALKTGLHTQSTSTIDTIKTKTNSRYLLFITENNSAINIVHNYLVNSLKIPSSKLAVIFGSSFRHDLQYTEICRNISLIKHSMEMGNTIILLNSYNLYESLYDTLNQYYYEVKNLF
jgi:E3 ubiquitin-protein ligase RNF213